MGKNLTSGWLLEGACGLRWGGMDVQLVQLGFQNVRILFRVALGTVDENELSVDCLKPPNSVLKNKQTKKKKERGFLALGAPRALLEAPLLYGRCGHQGLVRFWRITLKSDGIMRYMAMKILSKERNTETVSALPCRQSK